MSCNPVLRISGGVTLTFDDGVSIKMSIAGLMSLHRFANLGVTGAITIDGCKFKVAYGDILLIRIGKKKVNSSTEVEYFNELFGGKS